MRRMMNRLVLPAVLVGILQPAYWVPAMALPVAGRAFTTNELYLISSLSYQSAAAQAALSRQFGSKFVEQRKQIDARDAALGKAQGLLKRSRSETATARLQVSALEQEITALKATFVKELAEKDAEFARESAALTSAAYDLLKTPEGQRALAVYLSPEPDAAKAGILIFQRIAIARNETDKRAIARLGYDAYQRGKLSAGDALKLFEDISQPENRTYDDWVFLSRFYRSLVQRDNARNAAQKALDTAQTDIDRIDGYDNLGRVFLAEENIKSAIIQFQAAQTLSAMRLAKNPTDFQNQRGHAASLDGLGDAYLADRDSDKALSTYVESAKIIRKLLGAYPNAPILWHHITGNSIRMGGILEDRKDLDGALTHYKDALRFAQALRTANPDYVEYKRNVAYGHQRVGDILRAKQDFAGALLEYKASHQIRLDLFNSDAGPILTQVDLANSFLRLGEINAKQGNNVGALSDYQDGTKHLRRISENDPKSSEKLDNLGVGLGRVGNMLAATGDRKGAIASYIESLEIDRKLVRSDGTLSEYQRAVGINLGKLADLGAPNFTWKMVLDQYEMMQKRSMITSDDVVYIESVRNYVANENQSRKRR
jgi:tetratricopeptide (TPR) repeat protein